jgi:fatty acid desaturase
MLLSMPWLAVKRSHFTFMTQSAEFRLKADQLMPLTVRRDGPALLRAAGHFLAIVLVATGTWMLRGTWWQIPLTLLLGYLVAFLFCVEHETAHQTAFGTRWLNTVVGNLASFLVLLPFQWYRLFHWDHHRYTQDPLRDPELAMALPESAFGIFLFSIGVTTWRSRVQMSFTHAVLGRVTAPWVPEDKRALVVLEARCYLAGYGAILILSLVTRSAMALELWLIPVVVGQMFMRPYLIAEHTGCPYSRLMLENTRTTYTNALVRYFAWNMPYHTAHHAYPAVPFHALPQLNSHLKDHLRSVEHSYRASFGGALKYLNGERRERKQRIKAAA